MVKLLLNNDDEQDSFAAHSIKAPIRKKLWLFGATIGRPLMSSSCEDNRI